MRNLNLFCRLVFEKKIKKLKKNEFCMSNDTGVKLDRIPCRGSFMLSSLGQIIGP